jgi:hypothetical protein
VTTSHESDGFHVSYAGETCVQEECDESVLQVTIVLELSISPSSVPWATTRHVSREIFDRGMKIVLAEWRCHGVNALDHDCDLEGDGAKKVEPSVCLAQAGHFPTRACDRNGYEKHGQRVTLWNVTFSDFP